jgi:hypothetical protein
MKDFLIALYFVCADYHSGQWSKGYRLLCLAHLYCEKWYGFTPSLDDRLTENQKRLAVEIVRKYANVL